MEKDKCTLGIISPSTGLPIECKNCKHTCWDDLHKNIICELKPSKFTEDAEHIIDRFLEEEIKMYERNIKAIELYNILKQYSKNELNELDIVIEIGRNKHNQLGKSERATFVEEYPSQIRIISKE